jgi:hypothetical protein
LSPEDGPWTDDELAALDLRAALADGVRGAGQGAPTVAAAVQLERAGVEPEDVEFEVLRLSNEVDGVPTIDVDLAPSELRAVVEAAESGEPDQPAVRDWLLNVLNLMRIRTARGA